MSETLDSLLEFAVETAHLAGRLTLGYYQAGVRPDMKSDDTPVTVADRGAEQLIRGRIEQRYPRHAIVGEEFGVQESQGATHRWLIDPIDGTKAFVRGVPLYAVLLGLEIEGVVQVGAAYFPALDDMVYAATGRGCWWNGRRARVSDVATLDRAYVSCSDVGNFDRYGRERRVAARRPFHLPPRWPGRRLRLLPGGHRPGRDHAGPHRQRLGLRSLPADSGRGRRLLWRLAGPAHHLRRRGHGYQQRAVAGRAGRAARRSVR